MFKKLAVWNYVEVNRESYLYEIRFVGKVSGLLRVLGHEYTAELIVVKEELIWVGERICYYWKRRGLGTWLYWNGLLPLAGTTQLITTTSIQYTSTFIMFLFLFLVLAMIPFDKDSIYEYATHCSFGIGFHSPWSVDSFILCNIKYIRSLLIEAFLFSIEIKNSVLSEVNSE